jgi:cell wall-associated NlpC family hydrolase
MATTPRHATAAAAVALARAGLGTPWGHQARVRGVGVDCVGLLLAVARTLGVVPPGFDVLGYGRTPDGASLMANLRQHLPELPQAHMRPGDFVCVAFGPHPQHVGVVVDYPHGGLGIVHAVNGRGVVETRLMFTPGMRFVAAFALPEAPAFAGLAGEGV